MGDSRLFFYDVVGNLLQKTDRLGRVTRYAYDGLDRLTAEKWYTDQAHLDGTPSSPLRTILQKYNLASELTSTSDPDHSYAWTYDAAGRVDTQTQSITGLAPVVQFESLYNLAGGRSDLTATIGTAADFVNAYAHDVLGRLSQVTQPSMS